MQARELLEEWYHDVWVNADPDAVERFFEPQTEARGILPDLAMDPAMMKELVMAVLDLIDSPRFQIEQVIEQGDWAAAIVGISCLKAGTDQPVNITGQVMIRLDRGKIVEAYNHFDFLTFFEQLDILPAGTMALCLSGTRLN